MNDQLDARDVVQNPDFMLYRVDVDRAELHFLQVTKDTFLKSTYLDNRIQHTRERLVALPVDEVIRAYGHIQASQAPIQFIFHISFCCSTLLARALQSPGKTLVIREPWIFFQMSSVKSRMQASGEWNQKGQSLIDLMLTLLNKTYADGESILIKPTNLANNLIDDVMNALPASRGILLYTDLRDFLISNLKKTDDTKQKIPWLASEAATLVNYKNDFPDIIPAQLPHLRAAAVFWHAQMLHFLQLLASWPQRLRVLDARKLLKEPAVTLECASNWLQLGLNREHFAQVINGDIWNTNAKDPRYEYGLEFRERENRVIIDEFGTQIEETMAWTADLLEAKPVTGIEQQTTQL